MNRVSELVIYGLVIVGMAIANSSKLQQSESRIALIDERLAVTEERIDYTSKKKWTNYISTNTDLLAAKAKLERQQEEKLKIEDKVLSLLLDYEAANRQLKLLTSNLETLE